jgi:hypothetical protein
VGASQHTPRQCQAAASTTARCSHLADGDEPDVGVAQGVVHEGSHLLCRGEEGQKKDRRSVGKWGQARRLGAPTTS